MSNDTPAPPEPACCPKCGYTKEDQAIHGDHYLCTGTIPGTKKKPAPPEPKPGEWTTDELIKELATIDIDTSQGQKVWKANREVLDLVATELTSLQARVAELEQQLQEQHELATASATAMTNIVDDRARLKAIVRELEEKLSECEGDKLHYQVEGGRS